MTRAEWEAPPPPPTTEDRPAPYDGPARELAQWWRDRAEAEISPTVAKAHEYGSGDLIEIGQVLARMMGRPVTDAQAAELGVHFYLVGKVARWSSAIKDDKQVSDDTISDILIYARMVQRIRARGGWPA